MGRCRLALSKHAVDKKDGALKVGDGILELAALPLQSFQTLAHLGRGDAELGPARRAALDAV